MRIATGADDPPVFLSSTPQILHTVEAKLDAVVAVYAAEADAEQALKKNGSTGCAGTLLLCSVLRDP